MKGAKDIFEERNDRLRIIMTTTISLKPRKKDSDQ
jgi:hypothetical protein